MVKSKISRKELLNKPDEFYTLSARIIIFAREHSRQFGYLGIVLAALVLVYFGANTYLNYVNKKGQAAYNLAYYDTIKNIGIGDEINQTNLQKTEDLFKSVIDNYGISKASRLALPELAYAQFLQKKYDDAISGYSEFLEKIPDDPYLSLAKMALAVCYEEKGDFDEAIRTLEGIRIGPDDFFKEQAMLSLSRVYRLAQKEDKSQEILKEFIAGFKTSPFLPLAKAHLKS